MSGTWSEVFGNDRRADEVFMAWAFARYVEDLAASGNNVKALPMYANAWLGPQPGQPDAGQYPSGGPTRRVIDVWKAAAPSLDLVAPDIYVDDAAPVLADYHRPDNPLFVPEAEFRAGSAFLALGRHHAIGFSVFGIDEGRPDSQLARSYALLGSMEPPSETEGAVVAPRPGDPRPFGLLIHEAEDERLFTLPPGGVSAVRVRLLVSPTR
jgi:hypothetical protein